MESQGEGEGGGGGGKGEEGVLQTGGGKAVFPVREHDSGGHTALKRGRLSEVMDQSSQLGEVLVALF